MKIEKTSPDEGYITVTEEEYQEQLARGLSEEEVFKPGRHKFIRGGFLKRHPNFDPAKVKTTVHISLGLDHEVLQYFKQLAKETNADSYETLIKQVLCEKMEKGKQVNGATSSVQQETLLENPQFIEAVAERVKKLSNKSPAKSSSKSSSRAGTKSSIGKPRRRAA